MASLLIRNLCYALFSAVNAREAHDLSQDVSSDCPSSPVDTHHGPQRRQEASCVEFSPPHPARVPPSVFFASAASVLFSLARSRPRWPWQDAPDGVRARDDVRHELGVVRVNERVARAAAVPLPAARHRAHTGDACAYRDAGEGEGERAPGALYADGGRAPAAEASPVGAGLVLAWQVLRCGAALIVTLFFLMILAGAAVSENARVQL